jgi:hypothetical protein
MHSKHMPPRFLGARRTVGDVGCPDVIDALDREVAQQIRMILWPGAGLVVRGFGPSAAIPIFRINRCTRLRLIRRPRPCSIAVVRREPRNGQAVNSSSMRCIGTTSLSLAGRRGR